MLYLKHSRRDVGINRFASENAKNMRFGLMEESKTESF